MNEFLAFCVGAALGLIIIAVLSNIIKFLRRRKPQLYYFSAEINGNKFDGKFTSEGILNGDDYGAFRKQLYEGFNCKENEVIITSIFHLGDEEYISGWDNNFDK